MEGPIDDESLPTEPERNDAPSPTGTSASLRRKIAKNTYPWSAARAATLPSTLPSPRRDADLPVAKKSRLTVPSSATAEESANAEEDIPPEDTDADPMTGMASATRAPPSLSTLKDDKGLTRKVEPTVDREHNSNKAYRKEWHADAPMAPIPTSMQLRGWHPSHPSIYPTTGFTGMSIADQINLLQMRNGMNGSASAVARGLGQTASPCWNGWSPKETVWHPNIAQATGMTDLLRIRIAAQSHILETQQQGNNGYAGTFARGPVQATRPCSNVWNPKGSAWQPTFSQAMGQTDIPPGNQGNIPETQRNGNNWYTGAAARGPGQTTSPYSNGLSPRRSSTYHPTVTQATGPAGTRIAAQCNILGTQQNGLDWDAMLARDMRQATTSPRRNRVHTTMCTPVHTPVDPTIGRSGKLKAEEADMEGRTGRKGKWTADEDKELIRAVEKFAATRWKTIAGLIPGRTKKQCWNRWQYALDPSVVRMTERTGKWLREEDDKLVAAAEKYKGKNWDSIAALVPSRTKRQCMDRWHKCKSGISACADD
jgi:hypothetical protein